MRTGLGHGPLNRTGRTLAVLYAGWRHDCRPKHEDSEREIDTAAAASY